MTGSAREKILARLKEDLIGPHEPEEIIQGRPSDTYLTGILWPVHVQMAQEEDEKLDSQTSGSSDESSSGGEEELPYRGLIKPSTAGLSFAVSSGNTPPEIIVSVDFAVYELQREPLNKEFMQEKGASKDKTPSWKRKSIFIPEIGIRVDQGSDSLSLEKYGAPPGIFLNVRKVPWNGNFLVTLTLVNSQQGEGAEDRETIERKTLFQTRLTVSPGLETRLIARPSRRPVTDEDDRSSALLYRNVREYAVGHTCSASWEEAGESEEVKRVSTEWLPEVIVNSVSPNGDPCFERLYAADGFDPLSAEWLSKLDENHLGNALEMIPQIYGHWLEKQRERLSEIPEEFREQASVNLSVCRTVQQRMTNGAREISVNRAKAEAFRLANAAISLQHEWSGKKEEGMVFRWRPFQLGFLLLAANSTVDTEDSYRNTMDLLWFPTGGGKTEAYLGLVAYLIFYRRLSEKDSAEGKARVNAIMRYTLRTLTTQQFERAAALIFSCEMLRRRKNGECGFPILGKAPVSIGLWVGGEATQNRFQDVPANPMDATGVTPAQILFCPACHGKITWERFADRRSVEARCRNSNCDLFHETEPLPVWTVDEDVYLKKPSLVIGTVDKFAQITRQVKIKDFFGIGENPPDLIIQDELHLISGPLGTIAGLYEVAIDRLFSTSFSRPKIIGSTATIRRAKDQVRALFDRDTCQFPPPVLDAENSGFAVIDAESPGRLYCAVTTVGRSAKFTLQAVASSLLQSASGAFDDVGTRDPYWTLVSYFNSIRELGGALVLMQDDVRKSMDLVAKIRNEETRAVDLVEEMTSRRKQAEIRDLLQLLGIRSHDDGAVDALLATNMLSVGVDIPRLGLMLVNGQPKGISEYIQATSRVGRGSIPGLIVSVLNNAKPRDRSHYETFCTWHRSLYRDVEVTSVTPFASRARDKALHAALVALVRNLIPGMLESPEIEMMDAKSVEEIIAFIVNRALSIDSEESAIEVELRRLLQDWRNMAPLYYWDARRRRDSLLQDAEKAAEDTAAGHILLPAWPTPNNMRSVEPSTKFFLRG